MNANEIQAISTNIAAKLCKSLKEITDEEAFKKYPDISSDEFIQVMFSTLCGFTVKQIDNLASFSNKNTKEVVGIVMRTVKIASMKHKTGGTTTQ